MTTGGRRMRILLGTPARACHKPQRRVAALDPRKHPLPAVSRFPPAKENHSRHQLEAFSGDDDHLLARAEHGSPPCHPPLPAAPARLLGAGAPGGTQASRLVPLVAALFAFVTDGILVQDGEGPARPLLHHAFDQAWGLHAGGPRYCARHGIDPDAGPVPLVAYLVMPGIHVVGSELAGVRLRRGQRFGRHRPASRCRIGWRGMPPGGAAARGQRAAATGPAEMAALPAYGAGAARHMLDSACLTSCASAKAMPRS